MIKELQIQNFKCFSELSTFEFSKINLLTGINGRGKSSLLQSLLVLSQSASKNGDFKKLVLNDELINLGNFDDIKNSDSLRSENIHFNFKFDYGLIEEVKIEYKENLDQQLQADCVNYYFKFENTEFIVDPHYHRLSDGVLEFVKIVKRIHFVSADRLGPIKYVDKTNLPEFVHVGSRGEHSINILFNSNNLENISDTLYIGNDAKSIIQQTIEWMSYILDGAKIDIGGKEKESSVLYMLLNNKNNGYAYKPGNVGFGYSYVLPLIITGLIAKSGDIIIIENPEAHLHPRAQSKISEFFARVASCGIQVFIESHSEHILNGLRVSVLNPEINLKHDEFVAHYFNESFLSEKMVMDEKGKIANWPNGFFDQQELDLAEIFKYSRKA